MKKDKAQKHLNRSREHLDYLRADYIEVMRDPNWRRLDCLTMCGNNPFQERLSDLRTDMEETKVRIAKFERIVF